MAAVNEQRELANEVADVLSNPLNAGIDLDEVCHLLLVAFFLYTEHCSYNLGRAEGGT